MHISGKSYETAPHQLVTKIAIDFTFDNIFLESMVSIGRNHDIQGAIIAGKQAGSNTFVW